MTNAEWLAWFDAQSHEVRREAMVIIDALESTGVPGRIAHEAALTSILSGVSAARIAAIMVENVVKH